MALSGRLQGKVAIVTGGGRGIGAAISACFAEEGAHVAIFDIDPKTAGSVAEEISRMGGTVETFTCDITSRESVTLAVAAAADRFGPADVLINNAGANVFYVPHEMPDEAWDHCLKLDLEGAWICAQAVLPAMRNMARGNIVNIASTHSFKIIPHTFPYPVAKHGLIGLTRALGVEYAPEGIRVNAIAPGYIQTQLALDYWAKFPDPEAERQKAYDLHPPQRIGTPEEVAKTALFLASDEAGFINAETITIDGGRSKVYHD